MTDVRAQQERAANPLAGYWLLLRWGAGDIAAFLPIIIGIQVILSVAIILGFGLLMPDVDHATAQYLATGAPTMLLITVGLVVAPQAVGTQKAKGAFDWFRTLPVPRVAYLLADLTVWTVAALPGLAVALLTAWWRYGVEFQLAPTVVPAVVLVSLGTATIGYAVAVLLPQQVSMMVTQVLIFFTLLFSPITYPASNLPGWLQTVHAWLPFEAMGDVVRASLISGTFDASGRDYLVLIAWCVAAFAGCAAVMTRRT